MLGIWVSVLLINATGATAADAVAADAVDGKTADSLLRAWDYDLVDHRGGVFEKVSLRDRVTLVVFGFATCPDVCPTELSRVASALRDDALADVTALFVTLDPARDTVEQLAGFAPYFHERITALTGDAVEIGRLAAAFGVRYERVEQGSDYTIDHSTGVYVLGRDGNLAAIVPFGMPSEQIKATVLGVL